MSSINADHARLGLAAITLTVALSWAGSAAAEVRFGRNVFIGGHDFSHQTYGPNRRAEIHLYRGRPRNAGCAWRRDTHGGRVKICRLQTIRH